MCDRDKVSLQRGSTALSPPTPIPIPGIETAAFGFGKARVSRLPDVSAQTQDVFSTLQGELPNSTRVLFLSLLAIPRTASRNLLKGWQKAEKPSACSWGGKGKDISRDQPRAFVWEVSSHGGVWELAVVSEKREGSACEGASL